MTYTEYLLAFVGHSRAYYRDYEKYRAIAYQVYCSNASNPVSIERYMPLPYVDKDKARDIAKELSMREKMIAKLKREKDGKRTESKDNG